MRRFDKTKNMLKANLLAEQRYLESKGLIKEVIDNNPADNARQQYGDYEAGQQDYEERQKLKNMPNDNIIYNIVQNGKNEYYSFNSNDTGTAKIEVLGDNDGEVVATYYFELADLESLDNTPWVGLIRKDPNKPEVEVGDNASISTEAEEYITDMIGNSDKLVQSHNQYVNDNHEDSGGPESDRAESEYWSNDGLDENDGTKKSLTPEEIATYIVIGSEDIISRILNNIKDNPKSKEYIDALEKGKPYFSQYVKNGKLKDLYDLVGIHMPQHLYQGRMVNGTTWKYKDGVSPITV